MNAVTQNLPQNIPRAVSNTVENIKETGQDLFNKASETVAQAANVAKDAVSYDATPEADKFPVYMVIPTTFSYVSSVAIILLLFVFYLITIGAVASFQSKFFPNVYMFWDFITTGNSQQYQDEFQKYIKNVMLTAKNNAAETFVGSKTNNVDDDKPVVEPMEPAASPPESKIFLVLQEYLGHFKTQISWLYQEFLYIWNQLLLNTIIQGKTIHVVRR